MIKKAIPSFLVSFLSSKTKTNNNAELTNITKRSTALKLIVLIPPKIVTGIPNTIPMLNMLLPTILPIAKSDSPFLDAVILVTNHFF